MWVYFSVETTMFTIMNYPMSYIEFFGTLLNLWCVWLAVKSKILNWPVGLLGAAVFGILFWQIGLYSDLFIQVYFFITSIWGWWLWLQPRDHADEIAGGRRIVSISNRARGYYVLGIIVGTVLLGTLTQNLPNILPTLFPNPAAYPYLDAFITAMSAAATILMARKELESWVLWITVDVLSIGMYWVKDVKLVSVLYLVFLFLASRGLFNWYILMKENKSINVRHEEAV